MPTRLPDTPRSHSARNIFAPQSNTPTAQQPLSGVGQDNPAPPPAPSPTPQPAPRQKDTRTAPKDAQTHSPHRKKTYLVKDVQLNLWVRPVVKAELERIAEQEGVSVSATGGAFLEQALQQHVDMHYSALLHPIIEQVITKQMRSYSSRIAMLLVRVAFASEQTRGMVTNILGRQPGVTPDVLTTILDGSSNTAKGNITRKTPQLTELMEAVEHWMQAEEEGQTHA